MKVWNSSLFSHRRSAPDERKGGDSVTLRYKLLTSLHVAGSVPPAERILSAATYVNIREP